MGDTKIEWTRNVDGTAGKTWTPIRARNKKTGKAGWFCEHVSEGCRNCYADRMNQNTYFGNGIDYKPANIDQVELFLDEKILEQPLHWRKPQFVFPCSMTDLFGRWVKDEWLDKIFQVMYDAKQHTFQCLTKRPERMLDYVSRSAFLSNDPMPNVWLGVSVEDQESADERIPLLLETPAALRWISAEPLLGPVDLNNYLYNRYLEGGERHMYNQIDWTVVGGESGPKARPMHPDWARSLRDQCVAAGVPFFFKQWGEWAGYGNAGGDTWTFTRETAGARYGRISKGKDDLFGERDFETRYPFPEPEYNSVGPCLVRVGKKAAGRLLDDREWNGYPQPKAVAAT